MITYIFLATGVQILPGVDELLEPANITDLGLIRDVINPMARQAMREDDMLAKIFR